jgi:HlyD family secretion protein
VPSKSSRVRLFLLVAVLAAAAGAFYVSHSRPGPLVLTGVVTTDDVIVSPQVGGQVSELPIHQGDTVARDQLLAIISRDELEAEQAYYAHSAEGLAAQVQGDEAALRYQERETAQQIRQATATLAAADAQRAEAAADFENNRVDYQRVQELAKTGAISNQEVDRQRTAFEMTRAKLEAADRQLDAQRATLALARAAVDQASVRRSTLAAAEQERAAAAAQTQKAAVRLRYSEIHSPTAGIVDVCVVRQGEVVAAGQPLMTLIDPDNLWVRADVEESYIERVRIGDKLTVRFPSGETRQGVVFYRGVDAAFATQRDVSRTKRDIKTFEVRLRVDNHDRGLAVGMTTYVLLPTT